MKRHLAAHTVLIAVLGALTPWAAGCLRAQDAPAIAPEAEKILRQALDDVKKMQSFAVEVASSNKIQSPQGNMEQSQTFDLRVERPNKVALVSRGDGPAPGISIVSDGKELFQCIPSMQRYTASPAPASLAELTTNPLLMGGGGSAGAVFVALLADNPYDALLDGVTKASYVGVEKLGDVECHRIKAEQEQFDWEIWIATGDRPLIQRFVPDMTKQFQKMAEQQGDNPELAALYKSLKIEASVDFANWRPDAKLTNDDFAFTPPEGCEKVKSLFGDEPGPNPLLGKEAPAFDIKTLDGGKADLAQHKNKNIVILDFWATWCGPCRQAMPTISKVAKSFADKGVVFYAVDIAESAEDVEAFLKETELDVPVALDTDGAVAQAYGANAIPQTVIIGKDGRVQVVHVGLLPNLEEQLTDELNQLIEGKNLAAEQAETEQTQDDTAEE